MIDLAEADDWNALQLRLANQIRPLEFSISALVERVDREVKTEHAQAAANIRQVQQLDLYCCAGHGRTHVVDCRNIGARHYAQHHAAA